VTYWLFVLRHLEARLALDVFEANLYLLVFNLDLLVDLNEVVGLILPTSADFLLLFLLLSRIDLSVVTDQVGSRFVADEHRRVFAFEF